MNIADYHRLVEYLNAPGARPPCDPPADGFARRRVALPPEMSVSESLEFVAVATTLDKADNWNRTHYNPDGDGWCLELLKSRYVWSARTLEYWNRER